MGGDLTSPTKEQIRKARKAAGLTQTQAGELVGGCRRTWQDWEYGNTEMHPGLWELFRLKAEVIV